MHTEIARQAVQDGPGIFPADETAVFAEFFSNTGRRKRGRCRVATLPALLVDHPELANTVATLALEVVQERLPQPCATKADGTIVLGRERARARRVVVVPRHLFTINWMDTLQHDRGVPIPGAPCISWPEAYHAAFIPGFDRYVVTASRGWDDPWGWHPYSDHAIGWFDAHTDWKKSARAIVRAWWKLRKRRFAPEPWAKLLDAGSFGNANAHALHDAIWPKEEESDPKIIHLHTGRWERGERTFNHAKEQLDVYMERRRKKGEKVKVLKPPYRVGQVRAILEVDGIRVRVFYREEGGSWRKA